MKINEMLAKIQLFLQRLKYTFLNTATNNIKIAITYFSIWLQKPINIVLSHAEKLCKDNIKQYFPGIK